MPPQTNQSNSIPPPPPGYTLDSAGGIPPPPPGYTLDSQQSQAQPQAQEQPGFFKRLGQSLGIPTSQEELQAAVPHSLSDIGDMLSPGGIATKLIQNYASNAGQGFKQGFQEAGEADQLRKQGLISTKQAIGKTASAALNATVNAIPIIGPSMVTAGEDIARKNYAGAAGGLTGVVGQVAAPALPTKVNPNSLLGRMLLLGKTPEGAYESALKPSTTLGQAERARMINTGLNENIPVSKKGLEDLYGRVQELNNQISQTVAADPNRPVSTAPAMQNLQNLKSSGQFANQVNPRSDLAAIEAAGQEFQDVWGNQMTAQKAQAVKQGTYRALSEKYGEIGSASEEAQKSLARGLKDELARQFPELQGLNAKDSRLLDLQDALERAVGRISNHQLFGIGTPIVGGAVKAVTGSGKLAAIAGVMKAVLDNPTVKSKLAIALSQGKIPSPLVMPKIAGYAGSLGRIASPSLPFLRSQQQPSGGSDQSASQ